MAERWTSARVKQNWEPFHLLLRLPPDSTLPPSLLLLGLPFLPSQSSRSIPLPAFTAENPLSGFLLSFSRSIFPFSLFFPDRSSLAQNPLAVHSFFLRFFLSALPSLKLSLALAVCSSPPSRYFSRHFLLSPNSPTLSHGSSLLIPSTQPSSKPPPISCGCFHFKGTPRFLNLPSNGF